MSVTILQPVWDSAERRQLEPGQTLDLPAAFANWLIERGAARPA
jgi:hypothetical protein